MAKKYHLDTSNIEGVIDQYKQLNKSIKIEEGKGSNQIWKQLKVISNGNTGTLNIYIDQKGLYSHMANNSDAVSLWDYIVESTHVEEMGIKKFSFLNCTIEKFEDIVEYLNEENSVLDISTSDCNVQRRIKVKSKSNDEITLTLYKNGRLLFQGRAFSAARDFYTAVTLVLELEDSRENYLELFENKTDDIFDKDFEKLLPDAHDKMSEPMLSVLSSSIILINGKQKLEEYCCYLIGACRVLEGVLKQKFRERGITIKNQTGFSDHFERGSGANHRMKLETAVNNVKVHSEQQVMTKMYNFLRNHRNPCAHYDIVDEESNLMTYTDAVEITNGALGLINEAYKIMP